MNELKAVRLLIKGRVQRVGFRQWMVDKILSFDSKALGYAKNLEDKSVEVLIYATDETVDEAAKLAYIGPFWSRVDSVDIQILKKDEIESIKFSKFSRM